MFGVKLLTSVAKEYGLQWMMNRGLYSGKLKLMQAFPKSSEIFEVKTAYPVRTDLFEIDLEAVHGVLEKLSDEQKEVLISTADKAVNGVIHGFSSIDLNYGSPIEWQLNPESGEKCDKDTPWYRIPDFDDTRGDIKIIWEASRFAHFITFSRAYLLTGHEKYYRAFSTQLSDWLEKNVYGLGANFKCSQECSLRMVNVLLSFAVFRKAGIATDADESNVKDLIDRCYRKILSNFFYTYKCIQNNHTISELMGMVTGAWCCGDEEKVDKAIHLLDEVIDKQFTADGGYKQFSFNYQRLALQDLEVVLSIEGKIGRGLNRNSKDKIRSSALLLYQCQDESGDVPNYGSNDGALVFQVNSCGYRDFKSVINTAYALTTGIQLYGDGVHQEELAWFKGDKDLQDYKENFVFRISSQFHEAGLFTIRNSNAWAMIVLNDYHSRPAHMDQLHFDLWIDGVNVFCDSGTYSYASDLGRKLVSNESHNTVMADNRPQMNSSGAFMVYDWTERKKADAGEDFFEGVVKSKNGYVHHRRVEKKEQGFCIKDSVRGNCSTIKILFHTLCEVEIEGKQAKLSMGGRHLCTLRSTGILQVDRSKRSLYYLKEEDVNVISIIARCGEEINTRINY